MYRNDKGVIIYEIDIDAGHGGKDRSNRGPNGYIEADGALKISKYLRDFLVKTGSFDVRMTREVDTTLTFTQRTPKKSVDLALSIHTNAGGGKGSEVIYSLKQPNTKTFAANLSTACAKLFNVPDRGAKVIYHPTFADTDKFAYIRNAVAMNAKNSFIIEPLFHDNVNEEKILLKDSNLKLLAEIMGQEICSHFKVINLPIPKPEIVMSEEQKWAISKGISDGTNPRNPATREQIWTMLYSYSINKQYVLTKELMNPDSPVSNYAIIPRKWAVSYGISDGKNSYALCSREMIWRMLHNYSSIYARKSGTGIGVDISSISVKELAADYAQYSQKWVIGHGISDGSKPKNSITREQFWRMLMNLEKKGFKF